MTEAELDALVDGMTLAQAAAAVDAVESLNNKKKQGKLYGYSPQEHQVAVHEDKHKIIDIRGGNRSGKSESSAFTMACHITGIYPDWWQGLKFSEAFIYGVVSVSTEQM